MKITATRLRLIGTTERNFQLKHIIRISMFVTAMVMAPIAQAEENPFGQEAQAAAKVDINHVVENLLAGGVCPNVVFKGDDILAHLMGQGLVLNKGVVTPTYLAAIKTNINQMEAEGRDAWCATIIKAAKERHSEMLMVTP